ncbi:hypothetical protein TcasGA2_TC001727 [Tribolium castaneum]|uniref:Tyr recombinase domain-containing protein n=1 Tax=Tribolium castaneum TaxID=7070 RepID=D6W876_TRICA|nr:hypothetical protein TcasGA2_TC001727 [Tribolium castaneum]
MKCEDVNDTGNVLIITAPDTKIHIERRFTVIGETPKHNLNLIDIYKKYKNQRPTNVKTDHFFLQYRQGKCKTQVVGINTFSKISSQIATYLNLPDPSSYTGHAFRRSSASLLVDSGGDLMQLKKHGGWKSSTVAEGYVDESIQTKMDSATKILAGTSSTPTASDLSTSVYNPTVNSTTHK